MAGFVGIRRVLPERKANSDAPEPVVAPRVYAFAGRGRSIAVQIASFKDMYIAELQELASMEKQLGEALLLMLTVAY
jgi:hypothetical protein